MAETEGKSAGAHHRPQLFGNWGQKVLPVNAVKGLFTPPIRQQTKMGGVKASTLAG